MGSTVASGFEPKPIQVQSLCSQPSALWLLGGKGQLSSSLLPLTCTTECRGACVARGLPSSSIRPVATKLKPRNS